MLLLHQADGRWRGRCRAREAVAGTTRRLRQYQIARGSEAGYGSVVESNSPNGSARAPLFQRLRRVVDRRCATPRQGSCSATSVQIDDSITALAVLGAKDALTAVIRSRIRCEPDGALVVVMRAWWLRWDLRGIYVVASASRSATRRRVELRTVEERDWRHCIIWQVVLWTGRAIARPTDQLGALHHPATRPSDRA